MSNPMEERAEKINKEIAEIRKQRDADFAQYKADGRIFGLVPRERITRITFPRHPQSVIDGFLALEDMTTSVSDTLDKYGIKGAVPASYLKPVIAGKKIAGPAVTIRNIPIRKTPTQGAIDKDFITMATRDIYYFSEPGDVLVTDFGGNLDVSNMGGMSCTVAKSRGFAANIVNGAPRDIPAIRALDYPVWSCGATQITGKHRMECIEMNGPITLHDCLVMPGDLMLADDSGVCIVPYDMAEQILKECREIAASEEHMSKMITDKLPIDELRPFFRKRYQ